MERTRQSSPTPRFVSEVVEHQHALAEAVGAHLEAGAVGGERVERRTGHDCLASCVGVGLGQAIVLAVVEDDLEHPVRRQLAQIGGSSIRSGEYGVRLP